MLRELRKAMQAINAVGLCALDIFDELGEISVIGIRQRHINSEAEAGSRVDCPAGDRDLKAREYLLDHRTASRIRRPDQHVLGTGGFVKGYPRAQAHTQRFVRGADSRNNGVHHDGELRAAEHVHDLLRFAQRIGVDYRCLVALEGRAAACDDLGFYCATIGKAVMGTAVGALHHQRVATAHFATRLGAAGAQLEIAGIDKRMVIALNHDLRRPENMAGGNELPAWVSDAEFFAVLVNVIRGGRRAWQPWTAQLGGRVGDDGPSMIADVVAMGMTDERNAAGAARV